MYKLSQEEIREVVDYLQGSCKSIEEALIDVTDDKVDGLESLSNWQELCSAIDDVMFLCAQCGWWCEAGDYAENQPDDCNGDICLECGELDE